MNRDDNSNIYKTKYFKYKNKYLYLKQKGSSLEDSFPLIGFGSWYEKPEKSVIINSWKCALQNGYKVFDFAAYYPSSNYISDFNKLVLELKITTDIFIIAKDLRPELFNLPNYKIIYTKHFGLFNFQEVIDLNKQIKEGVIYKYGIGNIYERDKKQLEKLISFCNENNLEKPFLNEMEITLFSPQFDFINYLQSENIIPVGYFALKNPLLLNSELEKFQNDNKISIHKTILSYLQSRNITILTTSTNCEHIKENLDTIRIDPMLLKKINEGFNQKDIFLMEGNPI
ncbi:hypothetical protein CPAV1605_3 [seawater metagenome]|uniref:NADP-dependent oxidoreductase domain-containing protein n=1 Tax=seawater metagenome TaxID=1561972 RepID=A0A5E8CFR6_9ZZZZ